MHPPLENDLAELWRAIVNGQVEQSVKGKVWTLKESSTLKWHGDITSLYIRDEYIRIFRKLVAKRNTNVLVVGTPGIGKSSFLNYVLVKIGELEGKASESAIVSRNIAEMKRSIICCGWMGRHKQLQLIPVIFVLARIDYLIAWILILRQLINSTLKYHQLRI